MHKWNHKLFDLAGHQTTWQREVMAGTVSFFTIVYVLAVNSAILADAGIPLAAGIIATVLTAFAGCLLMCFRANVPIVLVPGMGINAMFAFTAVQAMGLTWQEALAAVFVSGILFTILSYTSLAAKIAESISESLKEAITVGIGLLLTLIGLQKGGIVAASPTTFVTLGNFSDPHVLLTLLTLCLALVLFVRKVPGGFLITVIAGTVLSIVTGQTNAANTAASSFSAADYASVFAGFSFAGLLKPAFWIATFSFTLVVVFENMGLIHGFLGMLGKEEKFSKALQANALSVMLAGIFGSSPTVSTVESAAGIAAGGKTGLTSLVTGSLFLVSLLFLPWIKWIPDSAIAPILIIIGGLMVQSIQKINLQDFSEGFPAFLIIALIPLTFSIVDGIAFGFIAYPLLKVAMGRAREVATPLYVIAGLFLLNFALHALGTAL
ncbi:NCS2 family permease [Brevibacillus fluminis]|uniref:NCS2 family permease n=1 Tax=Brevibacillus fluminis TaxID=511487 RepID=UPI003F8991DA